MRFKSNWRLFGGLDGFGLPGMSWTGDGLSWSAAEFGLGKSSGNWAIALIWFVKLSAGVQTFLWVYLHID